RSSRWFAIRIAARCSQNAGAIGRQTFRGQRRKLPVMRRALLLSVLIAVPALADDEVTHAFSSSISRSGIRRVIVDIAAGEVALRNGSGDRISISGRVIREYDGYREREKQQRIVDDVSAEIFTNADEALIRRNYGKNAQSWSAQNWHTHFRITVEVPRGMDVD